MWLTFSILPLGPGFLPTSLSFPFFLFFSLSLSPSPSPGLLRAETPGAPPLKNNQLPTIQFLLFHSITVYVGSFMTLDVSTALVCFVIDFGFSSRRQIFPSSPRQRVISSPGFFRLFLQSNCKTSRTHVEHRTSKHSLNTDLSKMLVTRRSTTWGGISLICRESFAMTSPLDGKVLNRKFSGPVKCEIEIVRGNLQNSVAHLATKYRPMKLK